MVEPTQAEAVKQYITSITGCNVTLESGEVATILKGDVKEQKGQPILIYRYQLVK